MFGYVRAYKPELTFSQFDIYKGVYCSLCKEIGKAYGILARLTLSYDFSFFALVRMALNKNCSPFEKSHCSFNVTKKCLHCKNEDLTLTAHISMLMVYYKFLDNLDDTNAFKRFFLSLFSPFFKGIYKKAKRNLPEADVILNDMYQNQKKTEADFNGNLDLACHHSADALGKLLNLGFNDDKLYNFGYLIGRWVYLIDAVDDYEQDKKKKSFNPLLYSADFNKEKAQQILNLTASQAVEAFESIEFYRFKNIISNVLYDGLHFSQNTVIERKNYEKSV